MIDLSNGKLKNVNDRTQAIYSGLNAESMKLFNEIFMDYIINYSFKTTLYFTIDEALKCKNSYIPDDSYMKYENIDIVDIFINVIDEMKIKDLSYVILNNCKINNKIFLNLLNQIQGKKIIYFSVQNNSSINNECIFDAMKIILNTSIQMLNLDDTDVSKSGKETLDKFFAQLNDANNIYVHLNEREKALKKLEKKIIKHESKFRNTMRLNKK